MADQRIGGGRMRRLNTGDTTPSAKAHNWGNRPASRIPQRVKDQVRRRDGSCQLQYAGCTGGIDEYDHVVGLAESGSPRTPVLSAADIQGVCRPCHAIKSEAQRLAGVRRHHDQRRRQRRRDPEPHPGQLP
jgi:hypothetical protein